MTKKITHSLMLMLLAMVAPCLTACSGLIYEEEGDCDVKLRLRYDINLKGDAFAREVKSVRIYIFDDNDQLVWTTTESGARLSSPNYILRAPLAPGRYRILSWCGADNNPGAEDFTIAPNVQHYADATVRMNRRYADGTQPPFLPAGAAYTDAHLNPLFHGEKYVTVTEDYSLQKDNEQGSYCDTISLTKDTNTLRILLQQLNGQPLQADDFIFTVTDQNGQMAADNTLLPDETIHYRPWRTDAGQAEITERDPRRELPTRVTSSVNVARAEIDLARLMADHRQQTILSVKRAEDGKEIIRIPVIDYALLVKGYDREDGRPESDQDYLDRQDEYEMVFFIDENHLWVSAVILINSWRVVLQTEELGS